MRRGWGDGGGAGLVLKPALGARGDGVLLVAGTGLERLRCWALAQVRTIERSNDARGP